MRQPWDDFSTAIRATLTADDDIRLWQTAINEVFHDAEYLCQHARSRSLILAQVGSCSHWLSPHNNGSWLKDGRFAWSSGYGGSGYSIMGLPEFDWFMTWQWNKHDKRWDPDNQMRGKRPLTFRVTLPARTARHSRAVIHAIWTPGSPTLSKEKLLQAYGFIKNNDDWNCTSTYGKGKAYILEDIAT